MKKCIFLFFFSLSNVIHAQVPGTPVLHSHIFVFRGLLDQVEQTASFALSTRKLRNAYTGPALRVRRSGDDAQADVAFDANNVVSDNSVVTIAAAGTSGLALNSTMSLASFRSGRTLNVSIWYDQSLNGYNGVQTSTARQPALEIANAGASNAYATLSFVGANKTNVTINQPLPTLLGSGLRGSVLLIAKILAGSGTNNSFGYSDISNNSIRWSAHMNWPSDNNYMYTDFGNSADVGRYFLNNSTLGFNAYKQYTLIRNPTDKIVRVSGSAKNNSNLNFNTPPTWSAGSTFGVGITTGSLDSVLNQNGFTGNIPEFILFSEPLNRVQYSTLENNQIIFWGSY
ncbi:hypothetical protein EOJ36_06110 [Sandaracinomonas limnophila]|uniref:Alpha-L-arabinofuranosidase B catalytic domain-containing protein n=1 Tax=Sandaracinomonas limnophila TaxID=1862386 RepID=A0A437PUQ5_9BACT|nr:hypothetical protein [Sandaracinomonas limnophila]RVU25986.1 hypothetical protein EOJ36_06110 [Sandaracinomonas limnophila]